MRFLHSIKPVEDARSIRNALVCSVLNPALTNYLVQHFLRHFNISFVKQELERSIMSQACQYHDAATHRPQWLMSITTHFPFLKTSPFCTDWAQGAERHQDPVSAALLRQWNTNSTSV